MFNAIKFTVVCLLFWSIFLNSIIFIVIFKVFGMVILLQTVELKRINIDIKRLRKI